MRDSGYRVYYIEKLTIRSWFLHVFPYLLRKTHKMPRITGDVNERTGLLLYYVDASRLGLLVSRLTLWCIRVKLKPLHFNMFDIRDEKGDLIWWRVTYEDSMAMQRYIRNHPEFQRIIKDHGVKDRMPLFLIRHAMYFDLMGKDILLLAKILFLIRVISQRHGDEEKKPIDMFFLSSRRPWVEEIKKWAEKANVNLIFMDGVSFDVKEFLLQFDGPKHLIKQIMYYWMAIKHRIRTRKFYRKSGSMDDSGYDGQRVDQNSKSVSPQMAVEYYGHLNLYSPELHSDLFFCQQSNIPRQNILIYFKHPAFPATDKEWHEVRKYGMSAVAINSKAAVTSHIPVFNYRGRKARIDRPKDAECGRNHCPIRKGLYRQMEEYHKQYDYWVNFIKRYNIKMHISWYKFDDRYFPLMDALQDTGGVGVLYQRSFENAPNPWTVTATDIFFGFSKFGAHLEKDADSIIPYYVVTGYLGDHRFALAREQAKNVRNRLQSHGAKKILTYFDENSVDDHRWNIGHEITRENYAYLLNKVLENPWLGLVLKPKVFSDLRKRLGYVSELFCRAEETGRCFIFEEGNIFGSHPPATASLAADIAIHGHLFAATAGVESALTGTPTLMLDREGYSMSPLYGLGVGRVIFKSWDDLWRSCQEHWNSSEGLPGFGDWSLMMDDLDPFRDGRAAERMGTYLKWMQEGFEAKLSRETVLADAAERYRKIWGKDKVFSVNCHQNMSLSSTVSARN